MKVKLGMLLLLIVIGFPALAKIETSKLRQQAEIKITTYKHQLNATLKANIELGGLKRGISGCDSVAKNMAIQSTTEGWELRRTSLKIRNPKNAPTPWEEIQLKAFRRGIEDGKAINQLRVEKLTSIRPNLVSYKYMKAITAEAVCLNCHGTQLSDDVKQHLSKQFPNDLATGYEVGDLMGAFTLEKVANIE